MELALSWGRMQYYLLRSYHIKQKTNYFSVSHYACVINNKVGIFIWVVNDKTRDNREFS